MKKIGLILFLMTFIGCSTVQMPDYIQSKHPYGRKISGKLDDIVMTIKDVLYKQGWLVQAEMNPSVYERRADGDDQSKDVLLVSEVKQNWKVFCTTYTHMNVFIHANADGAEVEIRYESFTSGMVRHTRLRNDQLANGILDQIEHDIESK